ncbi:MAG: alpha/beta fold hydrolase [Actinomycetota bacterium]|jgi:pimeloyl-ACP methyl ester carboxylesterase|nr:alpha/beta fold hydrolase [Actinomycetota bacterium]MDA8309677.1 alpha/beta fold hydrolase [Actinomycetota bacterium]MDA8316610.1 alpha/beta fold hydrolase [Actinomycetota bacterium]
MSRPDPIVEPTAESDAGRRSTSVIADSAFIGPVGARLHSVVRPAEGQGPVVCFIHGNLSSARFFESVFRSLPPSWHLVAPDLRGFGRSAALPVDATRGLGDFVDDVDRVLTEPTVVPAGRRVHLVGWSMGGGVAMAYAIAHSDAVASVTLLAPVSPYGFGGTKGVEGALCHEDGAGTGAGTVAAQLVQRLVDKDRTAESEFSPRSVLRSLYVGARTKLSESLEDLFVDEILLAAVGDDHYPGDQRTSEHWPGVAPGVRGVANALSPLYCNLTPFADVAATWPVLWVHGTEDLIVSDHSMLDLGHLGALGVVPGWPGDEVFPAQPMVSQTRAVLHRGEEKGGTVVEAVFEGCGHSPHLEDEAHFVGLLEPFVESAEAAGW